jgi:hypothetical protein
VAPLASVLSTLVEVFYRVTGRRGSNDDRRGLRNKAWRLLRLNCPIAIPEVSIAAQKLIVINSISANIWNMKRTRVSFNSRLRE